MKRYASTSYKRLSKKVNGNLSPSLYHKNIRWFVLNSFYSVKVSARIIGVRVGTGSVDGIFIMRASQHRYE